MKLTRLLSVLLVLQAVGTSTAFAQRKIDERRAVVPAGFIRIASHAGFVRVVGWDKDSLAVTGTVSEPANDAFIVEPTPRGARIGFWGENTDGKIAPSNVTVYVPRQSQVWVKTSSANVDVANVNGALDLFSATGTLNVSGNPRSVYAETMGGGVNAMNVKTPAARFKTASGAIRLNGTITELTAATVSGDINASLESFGRARLESVEGQIRYFGAIIPQAVFEVINHAGSITLIIPPTTAADFAFNLYDADLVDEFGIKKRWMMSNKVKSKDMTFGIGDRPTARVTIRSFKGSVSIRKQPVK
jgi:hypothetical protein